MFELYMQFKIFTALMSVYVNIPSRGDKNGDSVERAMDKESTANNRERQGTAGRGGQPGQNSYRRNGEQGRRPGAERSSKSGSGDKSYRGNGAKPSNGKDFRRNPQGGGRFYDKDKDSDYEKKEHRRSVNVNKDKAKEQQTDKMEVVKRLEKEKKAVQKKKQNTKKNQSARPQVRIKRTNNIDWTREYENDSFDDDDMYYTF